MPRYLNMPRYLTYPEATLYLQQSGVPIAEATLRRMVSEHRIPFFKPFKRVLFSPTALDSWVQSAEEKGGTK